LLWNERVKMSTTELLATVLLHLVPVFAILLFYPFIRKPLWRRLYVRLSLCFVAFWFGYYVLPVLLFGLGGVVPTTVFDLSGVYNPWLSAIGYYITVFFNVVAIFIRTALFVLPFAFLFAPLISIIVLLLYLRNEKASFREKLNEISYRYDASPLHKVKERLLESGWKEEKEIFKLMIVFLPISLYVLTLVLTAFSSQVASPIPGITIAQVGVFVEDLVAYLASFIAAIYLLYSSQLSFRGRYLGDKIRFSVNRFILTTGTILAFFSILAFVLQFSQYLIGLVYFVIYYVMITVIFAILLPFFEPFGSIVLIKIIGAIGRFKPKERLKRIFNQRTMVALILGFAVASASLLIHYVVTVVMAPFLPTTSYFDLSHIGPSAVSFSDELVFIRLFMVVGSVDILELFLIAIILLWFVRQLAAPIFETVMFVAIFATIYSVVFYPLLVDPSLVAINVSYYWVTGVPATMTAPGFDLPASRLGTLPFTGPLLVGAAPFLSLSPMLLLLLFAYVLKYWRGPLVISKDVSEENIVERAYSNISSMPSFSQLKESPKGFAFSYVQTKKQAPLPDNVTAGNREEIERLIGGFPQDHMVDVSTLIDGTKMKEKRVYETLRYLVALGIVKAYELEVESVTYIAAPQSLFITTTDGLDIFNYTFGSQKIDPALISGMLTAIISFVKEATKSRQFLRTIEHGDVVLVVEYGKYVFGTMVTDQETPDIRMRLRKFLDDFERRHADILSKWTGQLPDLEKDKKQAESIFKQT
jgi:hypothetical protein